MTRLTNEMRETVITTVRDKTIEPRRRKLEAKLVKFAQKKADAYHPPEVKKWIAAMPKKAQGMIGSQGSVTLMVTEKSRLEDPFNPKQWRWRLSLPQPIPRGVTHDELNIVVTEAMRKELHSIFDDWLFLKATLTKALWGCNTVKQLTENYPDLAKHLPKSEKATKALTVTEDSVKSALQCAAKGGCGSE